MKKVLIITYYWPPSGGAGVQRWLKFTKYLPEFGVEPIVLTVDPEYATYPQRDASLLEDVSPSLEVHHTKTFELYNLYKFVARKKEIPYGGFANEKKPGFAQKVMRAVRSHLLLPDPRKGWNNYAYRKAVELIQKYNIDTVVTTSPPHSTQLIGFRLKKKLNIKWIADMRDPWTDIYYYKDMYHSAFSRSIDKRLEYNVLKNADKIITVSDALKNIFASKVSECATDKFLVIPNGFDTSDFDYSKQSDNDAFTITYTGTITGDYPIDAFVNALKRLKTDVDDFRVRFVGKVPTSIAEKFSDAGLKINTDFVGYVPHSESVNYLMRSHALLLIIPNVADNKGILTGKLFEYIGSARHIVALGPVDGDAAKIVDQSQSGEMFGYDNEGAIYQYINSVYGKYKAGLIINEPSEDNLRFSRRSLTKQLISSI